MTATEVLRTICDRQGVDVLSDGKQLLGLFEDYSRGKLRPQAHALRVLVECGGNKRIAQMRNAPALQQKTGLHRLMQEMVTEYGLQETMARGVCGAVWEAFCGTEVPLSQTADRSRTEGRFACRFLRSGRHALLRPLNCRPVPEEMEPVRQGRTVENAPPKPKRVIDKSTQVLLILGVLGTVGFLLMALATPLNLAGKLIGTEKSGQWLFSFASALLAALTGWRCWRLRTEEIKTDATMVKFIYSGVAALFHGGVLGLSIAIFIYALVDMKGEMMRYMVLASPLAAAGAVFQATWHSAFWEGKPPKLKPEYLFYFPGLVILGAIAFTVCCVLPMLALELIQENTTAKGVAIILWIAVQIVLVVLLGRSEKKKGYLQEPDLEKKLAMVSGYICVLFELGLIYTNLTAEEGARLEQAAILLILLVLTVRRLIWIQKRGFVFPKPSKLSLWYSENVCFLTGISLLGWFIILPIFVIEIGSNLKFGETVLALAAIFGFCGFETLWHGSKAMAK